MKTTHWLSEIKDLFGMRSARRRRERQPFASQVQELQVRTLLSAITFDSAVLDITLTDSDSLSLYVSDGQVQTAINGTQVGPTPSTGIVQTINITGGDSGHTIDLSGLQPVDFNTPQVTTYVVTGSGNDNVIGTGMADHIQGGAGADEISGGSGDDTIYGNTGNDLISGNDGIDEVYGGLGDDTLWSGTGESEADNGVLLGDEGSDIVEGQPEFFGSGSGTGGGETTDPPDNTTDPPDAATTVPVFVDFDENDEEEEVETYTFHASEAACGRPSDELGQVFANHPTAGETLTFSITSGNDSDTFSLDHTSGILTLDGELDYEAMPEVSLEVTVTDESGDLDTATVFIQIQNVNEDAGHWSFSLGSNGEVVATAGPDTSLQSLADQGYSEGSLMAAAVAQGVIVSSMDDILPEPTSIDVTSLLPSRVSALLADQQQLPFSTIETQYQDSIQNDPDSPAMPSPGVTIGESGVDLARPAQTNEDTGLSYGGIIGSEAFGYGNCYGFVGVFNGELVPSPVEDSNVLLTPTLGVPGEGDFGSPPQFTAGAHVEYTWGGGTLTDPVAYIAPSEGLYNYLTSGEAPYDIPRFGDVALFRTEDGAVFHAAIVLGVNQCGDVFILQKYNTHQPYGISTVDNHPMVGATEYTVENY